MRFIRRNGKIIPIRDAGKAASRSSRALKIAKPIAAAGAVAGVASGARKLSKTRAGGKGIKVHAGLDALGLGLSVASGVVGAATFSHGAKGFFTGFVAGHGMDAAGIAANAASVTGRGKKKERVKQFAKQEARNLLVGNAVYAAGLLGMKKNRTAVVTYAKNAAAYAKTGFDIAKKFLGAL